MAEIARELDYNYTLVRRFKVFQYLHALVTAAIINNDNLEIGLHTVKNSDEPRI